MHLYTLYFTKIMLYIENICNITIICYLCNTTINIIRYENKSHHTNCRIIGNRKSIRTTLCRQKRAIQRFIFQADKSHENRQTGENNIRKVKKSGKTDSRHISIVSLPMEDDINIALYIIGDYVYHPSIP